MALLKAFACQVVLFGLYKLFLEEVVEAHLVPDELTRNCIVGFVCLMCFGIQLYTDIPDEDYAEADENPKAKSESSGESNAKKSESSQISATHEMVGSNTSRAMADSGIFLQFSPNIPDGIKVNGRGTPDVPVSTLKTPFNQGVTTNPVLNGFSETNICEESDDEGIEIDQFVAKKSDKEKLEQFKTGEVKDAEPIKAEDATEEVKQSIADEPEENELIKGEDVEAIKSKDVKQPKINEDEAIKLEEVTADVESEGLIVNVEAEEIRPKAVESGDVEPIKGDVTEPEQSAAVAAEDVTEPEQSAAVAAEDVTEPQQSAAVEDEMVIKSEDITDEVSHSKTNEEAIKLEMTETAVVSKCLIANGKDEAFEVSNPQGVTEEVKQSTAIEDKVQTTQSEGAEAEAESESLLANGEDNLPTSVSDKNTDLKIGELSEEQMTNGIDEEPVNNIIDSISSNITEETKSKSVKDEGKIGNGQETTLSSQPNQYTNDTGESLQSSQDISNKISTSAKLVNDLETNNKSNAERSPLVITEVSPAEKLTVTSKQKATIAEDVCVAPITIDISFIYACH